MLQKLNNALTDIQIKILNLLIKDKIPTQIAQILGIRVTSIYFQIKEIRNKIKIIKFFSD